MQLMYNTLIYWPNPSGTSITERILWQKPSCDDLIAIDIFAKKGMPYYRTRFELDDALNQGTASLLDKDPFGFIHLSKRAQRGMKELDVIPEKFLKYRDRAWEVIEPLVEYDIPELLSLISNRTGVIEQRAKEALCSRTTIYLYLRKYWQRGMVKNALLPDFYLCGGPGLEKPYDEKNPKQKLGRPRLYGGFGKNITPEDRKYMKKAVKEFREKKGLSINDTFDKMLETFYVSSFQIVHGEWTPIQLSMDERPSKDQFIYWYYKEYNTVDSLAAREGRRRFNLLHRPITEGSIMKGYSPGLMYIIDSTIAPKYLRNSLTGKLYPKPTIYSILDAFSQIIAGFFITLENASWAAAMLALDNAFDEKVAFCSELGLDITEEQWPCFGLPQTLLADRGEMRGKAADNLSDSLGIRAALTAPFRPDWKGSLERFFGNVKGEIRTLPGSIPLNQQRGDPDPITDTALDMRELKRLMIAFVLYYNKWHYLTGYPLSEEMIRDQVDPYPLELWHWGIKNLGGKLRSRPKDLIRLHLLPGDTATVTEKGIKFRDFYYSTERAVTEQWYSIARDRGTHEVPISYDPRNTSTIYIRPKGTNTIETCFPVGRVSEAYLNREWWEVTEDIEARKERKANREEARSQDRAAYNAVKKEISETAVARRNVLTEGMSKASQSKDLKENKKQALEETRQKEAWNLAKDTNKGKVIQLPGSSTADNASENRPFNKMAKFVEALKEEGEE